MIEILTACHIAQLRAMQDGEPLHLPEVNLRAPNLPLVTRLATLVLIVAALVHVY